MLKFLNITSLEYNGAIRIRSYASEALNFQLRIKMTVPSSPETLSSFAQSDILESLAATLLVDLSGHTPATLIQAARNRIKDLEPLANGESTFDAFQLERGMLQHTLQELGDLTPSLLH